MENLHVDLQELFNEIVDRGRASGATTQEAYHDLVEEVIEEHRSVGEIHTDDSTEGMEEQFRNRWPDYCEALGLDEKTTQL